MKPLQPSECGDSISLHTGSRERDQEVETGYKASSPTIFNNVLPPARSHTTQGYEPPQKSTNSQGTRIPTHEPVGDISHFNHNVIHTVGIALEVGVMCVHLLVCTCVRIDRNAGQRSMVCLPQWLFTLV